MSRIRLHSKYGLNPTMPTCFWCGKDKGQIVMLGAAYKGEAPRKMVLDYVPCDACHEGMEAGITCMEASTPQKTGHPPFAQEGAMSMTSPTGRWVVVKREPFAQLGIEEKLKAQIMERGKCFLDPETFNQLFGDLTDEPSGESACQD